jgi:hypothetical protein
VSSSADHPSEPPQTLCRECRNPIPEGARKCTKCASYQDGRRYVFAWSGLIGAVLAIAPLWSGAVSLWKLVSPQPAEVRLMLGSCTPESVVAYVSNLGGSSAMLGEPRVSFRLDGQWVAFDQSFRIGEDQLLSEPRETDIIRLSADPGKTFTADTDGTCRLRVAIQVVQVDERGQLKEASCDCG